MNKTQKPLLCIGHRGAMGYAPENTITSFQKALEMGVHCVELDVYFVDGHLVVFHDDNLDRVTNGEGKIQDKTFEYLRSLDCGNGERIPTLEEVVQLIDQRAGINIELKGASTAGPVIDLVKKMRAGGWSDNLILISSFDHPQLAETRALDPTVKIGALYFEPPSDNLKAVKTLKANSINPGVWFVDQGLVDAAHNIDVKVYVYTVNEAADIQRMRNMGVDGVFTNYPDRVLSGQAQESMSIGWNGSNK